VRSRLNWSIGAGWSVALDVTGYTADHAFLLADSQTFVASFPAAAFARPTRISAMITGSGTGAQSSRVTAASPLSATASALEWKAAVPNL